jgi:hypothetical protein
MKRNVNVFLAVVLVAMLSGGLIWLRTAKEEKLGWNIHDTYGEAPAYANNGAAYTNATFAGPSNDGGVMTLSPSRTMRHSAASSYAGAYAISYGVSSAPLTSSPISSPSLQGGDGGRLGGGLYTTSSKTFNSYGGGNGGAMSYSQSSIANRQSPIANSQSPIANLQSPIAYSTARRGEMNVAAGENLAMMAAENPVMAMTNAASAGNGFYGGYTAMGYSGSANYGQYTGMFGGGSRMGVRGRQNSGLTDSWLDWLYRYGGDSWGTKSGDENSYYYTFTEEQLRNAYNDYITNYWDPMWHPGESKPTFEQWLAWMEQGGESGYNYNNNWYMMAPVGDILPLLLIALLYIVAMYLRTKFRTQAND